MTSTSTSTPTVPRLLLIALFLHSHRLAAHAARSLSARRVRGISTARSADKYDRSITTFSPDGRLLQLEYALIAAEERGRGLTVCVEYEGVVVFAFPSGCQDDQGNGDKGMLAMDFLHSTIPVNDNEDVANHADTDRISPVSSVSLPPSTSNADYDFMHNTKIHRLSPTHLLLTSGLAGDSHALASAFRRVAASWTHMSFGEVVTARELAKEMGKVMHSIGLQPGARVLGVIGILIGLDDRDVIDDCVEVRMYRSLPGGTLDRCNVCCTGGGADASGSAARKDALETLLRVVAQQSDVPSMAEEINGHDETRLQYVIEEVARTALKYHPDSQTNEVESTKRSYVDVWLVSAAASSPQTQDALVQKSISPHRYLGKAKMSTRYARRVSLDQISTAARCLLDMHAKI